MAGSWAVARGLEEDYPIRPPLFGAPAAIGPTHVLKAWAGRVVVRGTAPLIIAEIHDCLHERNGANFPEPPRKWSAPGKVVFPEITPTRDESHSSGDSQSLRDRILFLAAAIRAQGRPRMGTALPIARTDRTALELRAEAARRRDGAQVRRLWALAQRLEGRPRAEPAAQNGMDRQTLRDWVHRYNADGMEGLNRKRHPAPDPSWGRAGFHRRRVGPAGSN